MATIAAASFVRRRAAMKRLFLAPLALVLTQCSFSAPPPVETETPAPQGSLVRIDLRRDGDRVEVIRTSRLESSAIPTPALDGEYMIVGKRGDAIVSAEPVRFPTEMIAESFADAPQVKTVTRATATAFVSAGADRYEILHASGRVATTVALQASPIHILSDVPAVMPLDPAYPSVRLLLPGTSVTDEFEDCKQILAPTDAQRALVKAALDALGPAKMATSQIGICELEIRPDGQPVLGSTFGQTTVLSPKLFELGPNAVKYVLAHEVGHAFAHLTTLGQPDRNARWPDEVRAFAAQKLAKQGFTSDFIIAWSKIHTRMAGKYVGDFEHSKSLGPNELLKGGWATRYGATSATEDMPEYVATAIEPTFARPNDPGGVACPAFAGADRSSFPKPLAVQYAKLLLVMSAGLLPKEAFDRCTNGVVLTNEKGMHLHREYTQDLKAGFTTVDKTRKYMIEGKDAEGRIAHVQVVAEEVALGVHRLDRGKGVWAPVPPNVVILKGLGRTDNFESGGGLVFVAEQSSDRVSGALFGVTFVDAFGKEQGHVDFAPFLIAR
jgi:hypothetical protein